MSEIKFNVPYVPSKTLSYLSQAANSGHLSGNGSFTKACERLLEQRLQAKRVLLTHSCTAALEMAAILCSLEPGDEVIMPSYTFVSTALAFVNQGAVPVFVDIRPDTLNIDEAKIEAAITKKTRAIVVVHYAGVIAEMDSIVTIARSHKLVLIEDAAQAICSKYRGREAGTFGDLATFSFHETKNIQAGEGGALIINNASWLDKAEIIRDKGTNRRAFLLGEVDKYTWVDRGSSYLPSEYVAAALLAQLEALDEITTRRLSIWNQYHSKSSNLLAYKQVGIPIVPDHCRHNGHIFWLTLPSEKARNDFINSMVGEGILCVFHYIPLHLSPYGRKLCVNRQSLSITEDLSKRIVRLPMWLGLEQKVSFITSTAYGILRDINVK